MMNCSFKMMNFAFQMMDFAFKMGHRFAPGAEAGEAESAPAVAADIEKKCD